jgi:hypothetical protein
MIVLCIYCIPFFALTYQFLKDFVKGWFKEYSKLEVILVYIFSCLFWPIGLILGLIECLLENNELKLKTEKENKREMVCEVLNGIKLK